MQNARVARLAAVTGLVAVVWTCGAAGVRLAPAKPKEAPPATRPAAERDQVLRRIEAKGKEVTTLKADFVQVIYAPVFDVHDTRSGRVFLRKPAHLRVDWLTPKPPEGIVYDGQFFWEIKHGAKQIIRWRVNRANPAGQGQPNLQVGPFKLLAGVNADELLHDYDVTLLDRPEEEGTHVLLLVPLRPEDRVEFLRLEVWVGKESLLPVRIRFTKPSKEIETWTLSQKRATGAGAVSAPGPAANDPSVDDGTFRVDVPRGYQLLEDPA